MVSEPQRGDFLGLVARRAELRVGVVASSLKFEQTCQDVTEAVRKSRIIAAAEQVNPDAGEAARPELALENATTAHGLVGAVSAGLDEAYFAALDQPELSPFNSAQPALEPAPRPGSDISL